MFNAEIVDAEAHVFCARVLTILRVFLALDAAKSGTRRRELLVPRAQLHKMYTLRQILIPAGRLVGSSSCWICCGRATRMATSSIR